MKRILSLVLVLSMLLPLCACSGGSPADSWLDELTKKAEKGDVEAMKELGGYYAFPDDGREPDYEKGIAWYERASDALDVEATNTLGWFYEEGVGVEQDKEKADALYYKAWQIENGEYIAPADSSGETAEEITWDSWDWDAFYAGTMEQAQVKDLLGWLEKQGESGNSDGYNTLADIYRYGDGGLEQDVQKAASYYELAIELGNDWAMHHLGTMLYRAENGLSMDKERGRELVRRSAELDNPDGLITHAAYLAEESKHSGDESLIQQAIDYASRVPEKGGSMALTELGDCFRNGYYGVETDPWLAKDFYEKAIEMGDAQAMANLGRMLRTGEGGLTRDEARGDELYYQSAMLDNPDGLYWHALDTCVDGFTSGNTALVEEAVGYYLRAAELGRIDGWEAAGNCYEQGWTGTPDYAKAEEYYLKGVELGHAPAMFGMCELYLYGLGRPEDRETAREWLYKGFETASTEEVDDQCFAFEHHSDTDLYDDEFYYLCTLEMHERGWSIYLALTYYEGIYVEIDGDKYVEYMSLAHQQGSYYAARNLAEAYETGKFEYDIDKAAQWWLKSAQIGNPEGMLKTGDYLLEGTAGETDYEQAAHWYLQALEYGNDEEREEAEKKLRQKELAPYLTENSEA